MLINLLLCIGLIYAIYVNRKSGKKIGLLEMENRRLTRENKGRPIKHCKCKRV